ncbi:max-interacting protein 1-like [Watersipora subatra]|uniref:max-interacting protein 1-like n=1 Tax=Watersipora subatra TaxID=2589382 RepID=UPI00355AE75B
MSIGIAQILQAAEYLDRREREAEHGYACPLPIPEEHLERTKPNIKPTSNNSSNHKKHQGNRTTHNELEKNRRAHLRFCLEKLKDMVPLGSDSTKHTTLGLLTKAKAFIRALEEKEKKQCMIKDNLSREHRYLKRRLDSLKHLRAYRNSRAERTISECSSSTLSNSSTSSISTEEQDEVDVIGSNDDSDDHQSSVGSDGGMIVTTKKLSLMDSL